MTTVSEKITTINNTLKAIKQAIINKGVTPSGNITTYATAIGSISGGGTPSKYDLFNRVEDDSGNEIGTVYAHITDTNNNKYAVVCLDAVYRSISYRSYMSSTGAVTDLPLCNSSTYLPFGTNSETATFNCDKILAYCNANGYTAPLVTYCRGLNFTIDNITYYGQLPTIIELFYMMGCRSKLDSLDTTIGSVNRNQTLTSWQTSWSSTQANANSAWYADEIQYTFNTKTYTKSGCYPILEIPLNS